MTVYGNPLCWGAKPEWLTTPILGLPPGAQVRRRVRNKAFAEAVVQAGGSTSRHYLSPTPEGLALLPPIGANKKD